MLPAEFENLLRPYCKALDDGDPIDPNAPLWSLGMDSIETVNLIADIEDTYDLTYPDALLSWQALECPASLWSALRELLPAERAD